MALYIDDNDNPRSARAQMMLLGPQINNMPSKSLVIVLLIIYVTNLFLGQQQNVAAPFERTIAGTTVNPSP